MEFLATETWLYDSPPIVGEIYREFVKYCYQQNLFIRNKMMLDGVLVNLRNINMPFLNVIAQRDDLVPYCSNIALNNVVGSTDKSIIEFKSGHVGMNSCPIIFHFLCHEIDLSPCMHHYV